MSKTILLVALLAGACLIARPSKAQSPPTQKTKGQVTVEGCVSRQSGDFILMQLDPANTYVLHAAENIKLGQYLGQRVKVTGTKSTSLNDTSDNGRSTAAVTITVNSIKTVSKECGT
jgi:hypothetical protein